MIKRLRSDAGQAIVLTTLCMTILLGAVALAVDVGSWYVEHRKAQAAADAAALAGAQLLPQSTAMAVSEAQTYADSNGGGVDADGITLKSGFATNDTISVKIARPAPGFFSRLFSVDSVTVHATAAARAAIPGQARWAAPIVVNKLHPLLSGPGCPCFNTPTTLPLGKTGAPGAFALVSLQYDDPSGTIGASTIADWILKGYDGYLPLGVYFSDPGASWNNSSIQGSINARKNTELLFPVYDTLISSGSNAEYHIIGWVGFRLVSVTASGSGGSISGQFTRVIWDGIQSSTPSTAADFGVRTINLVG
jgi:hypothetical protein